MANLLSPSATTQTQAIDDAYRSTSKCADAARAEEGKKIVEELARLKYEVQHDRALTPIRDDGLPDVEGYNKELEQRGNPSWLNVSWLYSECYLFRYISCPQHSDYTSM